MAAAGRETVKRDFGIATMVVRVEEYLGELKK
jgi:hypothetical protein